MATINASTSGVGGVITTADATGVLDLQTADVTRASVSSSGLKISRVDSSSEGGQLDLCRSTDNTSAWAIDVYGNTSTPSLRFIDNVAATERMRIDASGRVTTPYQPAFRARQTGSANYTSGSTLSFQTVDFNIGGHYSTATNRFTAPVSGVYYFSALAFAPPNTFVYLNFRVNGTLSDRIEYYGSNATYNQHCIAVLKYLNAGDYIDMTNPSGTVHLNGGGEQGSQFNGYLIG